MNDVIGTRMKDYEQRNQYFLQKRIPVALRIDGKSFHTFTRGFQKPFDKILMYSMQQTMRYLCENIEGAICGFSQSDEITIILQDYAKLETQPWFNYRTDKLCSIAASMATLYFNRTFEFCRKQMLTNNSLFLPNKINSYEEVMPYFLTISKAASQGALFDARCFNIPEDEVTNLIYWRQIDATRNSIQMVGQAYFSHTELQNKNTSAIQEMLFQKYGINWNDFPTVCKRGAACVKTEEGWQIDLEIPVFKGEGRDYIEKILRNVREVK